MNTTNLLGPHATETQKVLDGAWAASELAPAESARPATVVAAVADGSAWATAAQEISAYLTTGMHHSTREAQTQIVEIMRRAAVGENRKSLLINGAINRLMDLRCPHCCERIGTTLET